MASRLHKLVCKKDFRFLIHSVVKRVLRLQAEKSGLVIWWNFTLGETYCACCLKAQEWSCLYDYCIECLSLVIHKLVFLVLPDRDSISLLLRYLPLEEHYLPNLQDDTFDSTALLLLDDVLPANKTTRFFWRGDNQWTQSCVILG